MPRMNCTTKDRFFFYVRPLKDFFTELYSLIQPVLAISATEVIASSSAGIANIAPYQSEVTIRDPFVTDKSVIYITPVGTPSAQTPFLMRQIPFIPVADIQLVAEPSFMGIRVRRLGVRFQKLSPSQHAQLQAFLVRDPAVP